MTIKAKKLKEAINQIPDDAELRIGSGKRDYPVEEVFVSCMGGKVIFATEGYTNWKRKQQLTY